MNFFRNDKFYYVFGETHLKKSFEEYHKSTSRGVIIVADIKYKFLDTRFEKYLEYNGMMHYPLTKNCLDDDYKVSLIIVAYSTFDPDSYEYVRKRWDSSFVKYCNPIAPVILVACNADQRKEIEKSAKQEQTISEEMGVQLARRIKAAKFLECSGYDITGLKSINQNLVRVSARNRMRSIHAVVMGTEASGKTEMIQRFVQSDRLNVLDECLNGELYNSSGRAKYFSSFIEIDVEEHDLLIVDAKPICHTSTRKTPYYQSSMEIASMMQQIDRKSGTWESSYHQHHFGQLLLDVIVIMFSTIDRGNFDSIDLEYEKHDFFGKRFDIQIPIIVVGTKTDFRNDLKTLLSQENHPVTYEMGEQLARKIKAVKYLECSSSDETDIEKVFEEAIWALIRRFEEERKTLIQKEKGFLKRFFERLF